MKRTVIYDDLYLSEILADRPAERPSQVPAAEQFVTVVIWTVVAAFCVGFGIALIRGLAHIPAYIHRMGW